MRAWIRAVRSTPCGGCSSTISEGAPLLEVRLRDVAGKRARCAACAKRDFGEEPPFEFPNDGKPALEQEPPTSQPVAVRTLVEKFDPKLAQVGERDG